jgi:hypothetical protein
MNLVEVPQGNQQYSMRCAGCLQKIRLDERKFADVDTMPRRYYHEACLEPLQAPIVAPSPEYGPEKATPENIPTDVWTEPVGEEAEVKVQEEAQGSSSTSSQSPR